jgi:Isocitrate/isopropylmalate dehydrogenase
VHKANVLRMSHGLFLREVRKVAAEFPDGNCEEQPVDSMAALLVRDPAQFDVIVTTNMFGDLPSDAETAVRLQQRTLTSHRTQRGRERLNKQAIAPFWNGATIGHPASAFWICLPVVT